MTTQRDCWAEWVGRMRPGQNGEDRDHPHWHWRDRVVAGAEPIADQIVLDVGCGEGLLAFGALDRGAREVIFDDVSQDLLDFCRAAALERGELERCRFIRASADELAPIDAHSVDVVATRSVLIYVEDKQKAFSEFARVLRPGGRLSIFEPINRFARAPAETWMGYDLAPVVDLAAKVRSIYEAIQPPDSDPMLDFDERDLVAIAERAGFFPVRLEYEAEIRPTEALSWDTFVNRAGNPRIPTIGEATRDVLTAREVARFTAHLRPLVEEGRGTWRMATAYVHAVRREASEPRLD